MTYDITLCDHPHLTPDEIAAAEKAAMDSLSSYPEWLLRAAYKDHRELLDAGITHAERGESAWQQIEDEAYAAALAALHTDTWHRVPEAMHLEVFW